MFVIVLFWGGDIHQEQKQGFRYKAWLKTPGDKGVLLKNMVLEVEMDCGTGAEDLCRAGFREGEDAIRFGIIALF